MRYSTINLVNNRFFLQLGLVFLTNFTGTSIATTWSQVQVTHGPFVGAVTQKSARFLVRTDAQAEVRFELDQAQTFTNPVATLSANTEEEADFFVIIEVNGLLPNTRYYYRAVINNIPQTDIRSFMTFPIEGAETTFSFSFGSCQQAPGDPDSFSGRVFPLIAAGNPRFFLQLGDWTYPDTTDTHENPDNYFNTDYKLVQANYQSKYDPDYPMDELFKVAPIEYVYDDHDYSNNNSDRTNSGSENSIRGYKEMFPHYPLGNTDNGIWHKFAFGNADFFVLDTRTQRDRNIESFHQDSTGKYFFLPGSDHAILQGDPNISGELQMDWLIRELQASTAAWKFICSGVPFNPGHRALLELALAFQGSEFDPLPIPGRMVTAAFLAINLADAWNGFPQSVQRLVEATHDANIQNVIVLSGDSHTAAIDDGANSLFPEFMAGGLDRSNSTVVAIAELLGLELWNQGGQTLQNNNFNNHYGRVTVFGSDSVQIELIDEFDERFAGYTQKSGHLVSKVALTWAIKAKELLNATYNFSEVDIDSSSSISLLLMSTGADSVFINNIKSSDSAFFTKQQNFAIPPGERMDVDIVFQPKTAGDIQAILTIESNDPESPVQISLQGNGKQSTAVETELTNTPTMFSLRQNYPNPFNASTRITYELVQTSDVSLEIFNLKGQVVRRFRFYNQAPGRYIVDWHGLNSTGQRVASGVYIYRWQVNTTSNKKIYLQTRKMILLR